MLCWVTEPEDKRAQIMAGTGEYHLYHLCLDLLMAIGLRICKIADVNHDRCRTPKYYCVRRKCWTDGDACTIYCYLRSGVLKVIQLYVLGALEGVEIVRRQQSQLKWKNDRHQRSVTGFSSWTIPIYYTGGSRNRTKFGRLEEG